MKRNDEVERLAKELFVASELAISDANFFGLTRRNRLAYWSVMSHQMRTVWLAVARAAIRALTKKGKGKK